MTNRFICWVCFVVAICDLVHDVEAIHGLCQMLLAVKGGEV